MARRKALAAATEPMFARTPAAVTLVESEAVEARPQHAGKPREALLLRIGQALVERRAGLRDLFQRGAGFRHAVGAARQAVEWACLVLLRRGLIGRRVVALLQSRLQALEAKLCRLAQRLLGRRPGFWLVPRPVGPRP